MSPIVVGEIRCFSEVWGQVTAKRGDHASAESLLREACELNEGLNTAAPWQQAYLRSSLGECLAARGQYDDAEPLLFDGLTVLRSWFGLYHWRTKQAVARARQFCVETQQQQKLEELNQTFGGISRRRKSDS